MSRYFNEMADQVRAIEEALRAGDPAVADKIDALARRVEHDICLCSEMPGFPADLRVAVARAMLQYLPEPLPHVVRDLEDEQEALRLLRSLEGVLHDLFHDLGHRKLSGFTDDPLTPVTYAVDNARDLRESLARLLPEHKWVADGARRSRSGEL